MSELSTAPIHRIIKKAGASRVSEGAAEELKKILQEVGISISREALGLAQHAGRRTVKRDDVEKAARAMLKGIYG